MYVGWCIPTRNILQGISKFEKYYYIHIQYSYKMFSVAKSKLVTLVYVHGEYEMKMTGRNIVRSSYKILHIF